MISAPVCMHSKKPSLKASNKTGKASRLKAHVIHKQNQAYTEQINQTHLQMERACAVQKQTPWALRLCSSI